MANKRIIDLTLRSDFDETCNLAVHDNVQTWRVTGQQLKDFLYPAGTILGSAYAELTTSGTGSTTIPADDTIPQNNEGDEILTLAYTPKLASSYLLVEAFTYLHEITNTGDYASAALFRDSGADAISANTTQAGTQSLDGLANGSVPLVARVVAGSTSSTTFKLRVGMDGGSVRWNGNETARLFGGVLKTFIKVTEIAA